MSIAWNLYRFSEIERGLKTVSLISFVPIISEALNIPAHILIEEIEKAKS